MRITIPYGKHEMTGDIPDERCIGILNSRLEQYFPDLGERDIVKDAMEHPYGTERLSILAKGKKKVVILASDHTRPVPSKVIMPLLLAEIRKGNPSAEITILVATGCHRETRKEELVAKFGEEIARAENIVIHDCDDEQSLVSVGRLPSGGELIVNRLAMECDLLLAEGFIEPHFFAGFSGGRKSVLPGIASRRTVLYNHNSSFINHPHSRTGVLVGNMIHEDMVFAAQRVGLRYICNVVLNAEKKVVYAVAGDPIQAHEKGCYFLSEYCGVAGKTAHIVITSNGGYPLDQNIYQAVKGMTAAENCVRPGGVIIMLAKSEDGHGGEAFYKTFREEKNVEKLMSLFLETEPEKTVVDQWQSQILARVLLKAKVIFVSDAPDDVVKCLHMVPAHSIEEALRLADEYLMKTGIVDGDILVIPDGVSVMVHTK